MKKIVLAPNPYRDRGLVLTNRAKELLELDGRETVVSPVFVDVPGDSNMVPLRRAAEEALPRRTTRQSPRPGAGLRPTASPGR